MYTGKIKYVHIMRLWGIKDIKTVFDPNVNIFIGANGSNKTVFLNLIEAALTVDIKTLVEIDFSKIEMIIDAESNHLEITKESKEGKISVEYKFGNDDKLDVYVIEPDYLRVRRYGRYDRPDIFLVRKKLMSMINISWLSINRGNLYYNELDSREIVERFKNMVDVKIEELVKSLGMYQLQLESEANTISNDFKKEVMSMMLFDEKEDNLTPDLFEKFNHRNTSDLRIQLFKAFNALGIARDRKEAIELHIKKVEELINNISKNKIEFSDAFVLALMRRTFSIVEISQKHEAQTKELFLPIDNFWKCLKRFMPDKEFAYDKERGEMTVTLKEKNRKDIPLSLSSLSSGEKQLLILLTEALLQRERNYLFIADEPELSLHVKWQKMILPEMLKINPNAQIIVATHSPEVASNYPDKIINMSTISSYNE